MIPRGPEAAFERAWGRWHTALHGLDPVQYAIGTFSTVYDRWIQHAQGVRIRDRVLTPITGR